jgi:hypothetical protein
MDVIYTGGKDAAGNDFYTPGLTTDYVPTETTGIPQGLTQDALNASYRAAIYKGKKYNTTPISYIFWNMTTKAAPTTTDSLSDYTWVKYSPKSVWRNDNEPWLIGSTKLWSVTPISASERQKWLDGLTGAFIGGLPLRFGFEGGLAATLLDITGLQTALACTYQDVLKQTGTYLLNGMLLTSQDRFFINRGPAIQYAPGYVPAIEGRKCTSIPITNKICADRLNIRRMAKLYTYKRQTRRVKRVTGIVPDTVNNNCVYFIQDIGINPADNNRDIPGTEASYSYALPFTITNKNTCAYTPTGLEILDALGETNIGPIPYKSSDFAPALTSATFNALSSTPNPAFPRSSCAAASRSAYSDCSKQAIQDKLIADFNSQYMIVEGDPSQGYTAKITSIRASKTPLPKEVNAQGPVCVYDANVVVKKNGADQPATSAIITMSLAADPSDTCGYTLDTHDYPKNYFLSQVPRTGFIELPPFQSATRSILRDTCTDAVIQSLKGTTDATQVTAFKASYSDCSGQEMIDRLVRVYNSRPGRTQKILRVVAASTPALSDGKLACDYEVDILRKSTDAIVADQKYYLDHDTVRLYLTPATDNACLYDIDWSADLTASMRGSGASIDPSSGLQNLVTQYIWSSSYATGIRKALNAATGMFRSLDVPNTVKSATQDTKTRVGTLARGLSSGVTLEGCAPLTSSTHL